MSQATQEINVRLATPADVPYIIDMLHKFKEYPPYNNMIASEDKARAIVSAVIDEQNAGDKVIIVIDKLGFPCAFIAGFLYEYWYSAEKIAQELVWWVEPEDRRKGYATKLLEAFEYWAKRAGANLISTASPSSPDVDKLLMDRGYNPLETYFYKKVD